MQFVCKMMLLIHGLGMHKGEKIESKLSMNAQILQRAMLSR